MYKPIMCRECCLQVCASLSACVPCLEKRFQQIETRIFKTEQQLNHIKKEVDANTTCRKNQALVVKDIANLELRIEKLTQYYEILRQNSLKDYGNYIRQSSFDKRPRQFEVPQEIKFQEKRRQWNEKEISVGEIQNSLNEIEKWSHQSLHRLPDERNKDFSQGAQKQPQSHLAYETLQNFNDLPQSLPQEKQNYTIPVIYPNNDITGYLQEQQEAFVNLYNMLKTDGDPSIQAINSPERSILNRGRILSQDKKISACVEQLQKEFQHLAELLNKEQTSSTANIDHIITQKLEELGKKFKNLTEILKSDSSKLNPDLENLTQVSHYEQIGFYLEELQLEFQQLSSLLKQKSPITSHSEYPKFNDEHITTCIQDIQKRFQRLTQLLNSDIIAKTDIANQDDLIANYLQELQQEFQQLNGLLKSSSPSQN